MTFASDTVRILYHQLPTVKQVAISDMEERLAARRQRLHIDAVMQYGNISEVVVRITFDYQLSSLAADSSTSN